METSSSKYGDRSQGEFTFLVDFDIDIGANSDHIWCHGPCLLDPSSSAAPQLRTQNLFGRTPRAVSCGEMVRLALRGLTTLFRERSPDLPGGFFNWIGKFNQVPDTHVLNHHTIDGFLLLRYLKISATICLVGCLITWPILFPVNATGNGGQKQLDLLSFSNVVNKNRYYAHTFVAWFYFCK